MVIAARQEAEHLRATLTALLAQSYPAFEVVLVNDRSTDATGSIADEMARADGRLQVVHVTSLPGGWLGKTHAMHAGAAQARGDYLLFTDGDVVFAPGTLTRAMRLVVQDNVDHLAVLPCITSPSRIVRWSVGAFSIFFLLFTRAWQVADPRSRASIGIGAFNLVRTSVYRAAGGHEPIRLRPDDDLRLGRLLKSRGATAAVWRSAGMVQVDWYPSVRALIHGMEKNSFAALDYRVGAAIASFMQPASLRRRLPGSALGDRTAASRRAPGPRRRGRGKRRGCPGGSSARVERPAPAAGAAVHGLGPGSGHPSHPASRRHRLARHVLSAQRVAEAEAELKLGPTRWTGLKSCPTM